MSILTITQQGAKLHKESQRLQIKSDDELIYEVPIKTLESIIIFGNVQFTEQAISLMSNNGVPLSLLSYDGKYKGQFLPVTTKNIDLRVCQYQNMVNDSHATELVQFFLAQKIINSIYFLKIANKHYTIENHQKILNNYFKYLNIVYEERHYEALLGYEGNISKFHFEVIRQMFKKEMIFTVRTKHPPKDEVNALLSFTYVLLFNLINSMVYASGLDPYIGFLHKPRIARASLALDILELFRANVADKFVIYLCNKEIITKKDFYKTEDSYRLRKEGLQKYLNYWSDLVHQNNDELIKKIEMVINTLIAYLREKRPLEMEEMLCL